MDDFSQDAWFYSKDGEKIGPVSLSELRIKVAEGGLHPRQDLVWSQGMETWQPAGTIEGLFEKRPVPQDPVKQHSSTADPYRTPETETVASQMARESNWEGVGRLGYFFAVLIFPFLLGFTFGIVSLLLASRFGEEITALLSNGVTLVTFVVSLVYGLKRLTNLGMSRWWFLGNFVPFLNFWVGYRCFACPPGYAFHKKMDGIGIFLAIIYWLSVLLVAALVTLLILAIMGQIDFPPLQQFLSELEAALTPQPE